MISSNRNTFFSLVDVSGSEGQKKRVSKCRDPRKCLCYSSPQKHSVYILFEVDVEQRLSMWNNELNPSPSWSMWFWLVSICMLQDDGNTKYLNIVKCCQFIGCTVFQACWASGMFYFRWSCSVKPSHQQTWRLIYKLGFKIGYDVNTSLKSPDSSSLLMYS